MALPKSAPTERGRYLLEIVTKTPADDLVLWSMPTKNDYVLIGGFIVLYSYIDLNLRRFIEVLDKAGVLPSRWKGKKCQNLSISDVEKVIQGMPDWNQNNQIALQRIERYRGLRNLLAHFAIRRFPEEDAFVFVTKSARDYKQEFGTDPEPGSVMTGVMEVSQIRDALKVVEGLLDWLSKATREVEDQFFARSKRKKK
jgi:hypothetical protein